VCILNKSTTNTALTLLLVPVILINCETASGWGTGTDTDTDTDRVQMELNSISKIAALWKRLDRHSLVFRSGWTIKAKAL